MSLNAADLMKKVKHIQIRTNRVVDDVFAGQYASAFKGIGIEFEEVREYHTGDDVRTIDWNVSARMGKPYVKKYVEERELTVMLMVDVSPSVFYGTVGQSKKDLAAELCAVLAFSAVKNNDKIGLMLFTDRVEEFLPPKKGSRHVLRVVRELLHFESKGSGTDIGHALKYMTKVMKRRCVVFLVSDFLSGDYEKSLQISAHRHDIIPITITDPTEIRLPDVGLIEFEDAETNERVLVDTSSQMVRRKFEEQYHENVKMCTSIFRSAGIDSIDIINGQSYVRPIRQFFRNRERLH
jgi:uncharacterized protein (DUF58 family)